jgi:hypothetical protein
VKIKKAIEEGMREILNFPFLERQQLCKSGNAQVGNGACRVYFSQLFCIQLHVTSRESVLDKY